MKSAQQPFEKKRRKSTAFDIHNETLIDCGPRGNEMVIVTPRINDVQPDVIDVDADSPVSQPADGTSDAAVSEHRSSNRIVYVIFKGAYSHPALPPPRSTI